MAFTEVDLTISLLDILKDIDLLYEAGDLKKENSGICSLTQRIAQSKQYTSNIPASEYSRVLKKQFRDLGLDRSFPVECVVFNTKNFNYVFDKYMEQQYNKWDITTNPCAKIRVGLLKTLIKKLSQDLF